MNFGGTVKLNPVGIFVLFGLSFIFLLYILAGRKTIEKEVNLKELLIAAINVAKEGGNTIIKFGNAKLNERSKGKTKEGAPDLVTDADYQSHCVMYYSFFFAFPSLKIISEEKQSLSECQQPGKWNKITSLSPNDVKIDEFHDIYVPSEDVTVWIDPLDATKEFTENLTEYVTTMVCIAVRGKPIIGVIHQPFDKHSVTSWAWVGKGASPDLIPKKTEFADERPVIIVSLSHAGNVSQMIKKSMPEAEVIGRAGSGYKVLQLIKGRASAYVHTTFIKKWDICAGSAILEYFGGRMSTLNNEDINYSQDDVHVVEKGLLATVTHHNTFYQKLMLLKT